MKSILDIGATLEYLETAGVPVVTFGADQFPAFYSRESGFAADCRVDDPAKIAAMMKSKAELGLRGGMLVACPIPQEDEIPYAKMDVVDLAGACGSARRRACAARRSRRSC